MERSIGPQRLTLCISETPKWVLLHNSEDPDEMPHNNLPTSVGLLQTKNTFFWICTMDYPKFYYIKPEGRILCFVLFDLILCVPSTIFQLNRDGLNQY